MSKSKYIRKYNKGDGYAPRFTLPNNFKLIQGFDSYGIDQAGRVFSKVTGKLLKPGVDNNNRFFVNLYVKTKIYPRQISRLVGETFIGPRPKGMFLCHNDGNPQNNSVDNLRYDTPAANAADKLKHGTHLTGENHPSLKLSRKDIEYIRKNYVKVRQNKSNVKDLCEKFNVSVSTISRVLNKCWVDKDE